MPSQRHKAFSLFLRLSATSLVLSACANQTTSYRTQRLGDSPMVITTDAFQRHLLMIPAGAGAWRTCAEAAPDVFSAMSGSGGADLGFNSSGPGTEAQARAAMAVAQTAGTAERTQTINLLRESMFRTCERYVNGGIDQATLVVQAGRDWRAMIAILAIEQLTQTGRPASTVISGPATAASVLGGEDARRELEEARKRLTAGQGRQREAEALPCEAQDGDGDGEAGSGNDGNAGDDDGANTDGSAPEEASSANSDGGGGSADADGGTPAEGGTATTPAASGEAPDTTTDEATNTAACTTRQQRVDAAASEVQEAQADIDEAQEKLDRAARSSASTSAGHMNAVSGGRSMTPAALRIVAPVIERIVMEAFGTDETQLFCLQILRHVAAQMQPVQDRCLVYLMERVDQDTVGLLNQRVLSQQVRIRDQTALAQIRLAQHFAGLSTDEYERERTALTALIGRFCEDLSKEQCVARILGGRVIAGLQDDVLGYLRERELEQERRR